MPGGVGWGGVGWDNNVLGPGSCVPYVPSSDTLAATLNMASSSDAGGWGGVGWGGVGWDNNVLAAAFLPLTLAATLNMASSPDAGGFLTRQACI